MKDINKCPICKGSGELEKPYGQTRDLVEVKKKMAKVLRKNGYSYRQIQRFLGYKSPRSIQDFINTT